MMVRRWRTPPRFEALALALLLAPSVPAAAKPPSDNWREIITQRDRTRLKDWRTTWVAAVNEARTHGFGAQIDAEGVLLQPDAALDQPEMPDGLYRCRTFKLGTQLSPVAVPSPHPFEAFPAGHCRLRNRQLVRLDGPQRPGGRLFPYDGAHLLFLGGLALGDEVGTVRYGRDPQRAIVGLLERVGPARWRLVLPQPAWGSRLDILELVPERP